MKILNEDEYEEMAAAFQCIQIQALYKSLKENGIDSGKIRKICEDYSFQLGHTLDNEWIESEEGNIYPVIGFTRQPQSKETNEMYMTNGSFSFSDYAMGNVSWFFDQNDPDESPQKHGTNLK